MNSDNAFDVTINNAGDIKVVQMGDYLTPIFALRDCLKNNGYLGAFPWVSAEDTEKFPILTNCAYFKSWNDDFDGVYLIENKGTFIGESTLGLKEPAPENERDLLDENNLPDGFLVKKNNLEKIRSGLIELANNYKKKGELFQYRVDCA